MGAITLTVEGSTVGTVAEGKGVVARYEVAEADSARLIAAMAAFYRGKFVDEERMPFTPTIAQVVAAWFDDVVRLALNQTRDHEARKSPPPVIAVTKR